MLEKNKIETSANIKLRILPYIAAHQSSIDTMMFEIRKEYNLPISVSKYNPRNPDFYWVAEYENNIVGTVALNFENEFWVLKKMFVKKEYRGKVFGVSQQLLNTAINKCIDNNFNVIYLGTLEIFKEAQKFYEKNNFVNISKEELPRNFPNNPIDTVFYKLEIQKTL